MNHPILYLECSSGISGDMVVAALLDLGADRELLLDALSSLPLDGYTIEISDVYKSGIRACDFRVILAQDNHDHDMVYLHGKETASSASSGKDSDSPGAVHHAHQEHPAHPATHDHHHSARNLQDITAIIKAGRLTEGAQRLALQIFHILAEAEGAVHGKPLESVHFHEVGAVDSIVDIVAAAVCIDLLQPSEIVISPLTDGHGQIRCQHGLIPIPVPAVVKIAEKYELRLKLTDVEGELVTPTGAAIAAALSSHAALPAEFQIQKAGFGAGKRDYATSGFLRAMMIQPLVPENHDTILTLETNIDDCSGEALSFTVQELLNAGALDAFFIPIYMKKNRPAYLLKVICQLELRETLESIIFRNTTTIGIRAQEMQRTKLIRKIIAVETPWGMADVKYCLHGNTTYCYPENDSVCQLAREHGIGFPEMYHLVQAYALEATKRDPNVSGSKSFFTVRKERSV